MKKFFLIFVLIFLSGSAVMAQTIPADSLYLGQTPPGNTPKIFAPGIVSLPNRNEAVITFSPDGATVFFYIEKYPQPGNPYTMFTTYINNHWTVPDTIPFSVGRLTGEPFFAYNGNRLYMFATNAVNHVGNRDLSYSEKQGENWSNPISMGNPPNSESNQYHPCIVGDTSIYFSSGSGNICRCQYYNGLYQNRTVLPIPVNYIGAQTWGDPFVSPDESYMILKSIREEGYGENDIYISYRKPDSTWTNPKNLGNIINTPNDETSGDITPDGLYMTYGSNKDLYWVSTNFIDSLKYTNFLPYVKNLIPDQTSVKGESFVFSIPDTTFLDDDGNNTLTYEAVLSNGEPLPEWLSFDTITATFTGTPDNIQTLNINVRAIDSAGANVSTPLKIKVEEPSAMPEMKEQNIKIFPNPTTGMIYISSDKCINQPMVLEIRNPEGRMILSKSFKKETSIDLTGEARGLYVLILHNTYEMIVRKIIL